MPDVTVGRRTQPRGWTFDLGIPEIVRPYTSPTAFEQYSRLRFGGKAAEELWRKDLSHGGLLYYRGLTGDAAQQLLDLLPPACLKERQNDSPTVGCFLRSAAAHPDEVELSGYCVGPEREDERFAVEALRLYPAADSGLDLYIQTFDPWAAELPPHDDRCQCRELWRVVQQTYGVDDAITFPTEMGEVCDPLAPEPRRGWRLWWT